MWYKIEKHVNSKLQFVKYVGVSLLFWEDLSILFSGLLSWAACTKLCRLLAESKLGAVGSPARALLIGRTLPLLGLSLLASPRVAAPVGIAVVAVEDGRVRVRIRAGVGVGTACGRRSLRLRHSVR